MHIQEEFPDSDYQRLADFRYALRRFLLFSEKAALSEGLKPTEHQALLTIRGQEKGVATLNVIAERLCISTGEASELVDQMVQDQWLSAEACHSALATLSYALTEKKHRSFNPPLRGPP